jgi:hypothetical protein
MHEERRHEPRHPFRCGVEGRVSASREKEPTLIRGSVVDLSADGACIVGDLPEDRFAALTWRFNIPDVPTPLPVLAQIRWVKPESSVEKTFRFGLAFLP